MKPTTVLAVLAAAVGGYVLYEHTKPRPTMTAAQATANWGTWMVVNDAASYTAMSPPAGALRLTSNFLSAASTSAAGVFGTWLQGNKTAGLRTFVGPAVAGTSDLLVIAIVATGTLPANTWTEIVG